MMSGTWCFWWVSTHPINLAPASVQVVGGAFDDLALGLLQASDEDDAVAVLREGRGRAAGHDRRRVNDHVRVMLPQKREQLSQCWFKGPSKPSSGPIPNEGRMSTLGMAVS